VQQALGFECKHDEVDLFYELNDQVDKAIGDIAEAKSKKLGSDSIEQLESDLEALKREFDTANRIDLALRHELNRLRQGSDSELEIVYADNDRDNPRFTKYSVYTWLREQFNLNISEWAPPGDVGALDEKRDTASEPPKKPRKFREDNENGYQRTIEGLVALLLRTQPKYLENDKSVNQSKIADDIIGILTPHPRGEEIPKKRTIERKLSGSGVGKLTAPDDN